MSKLVEPPRLVEFQNDVPESVRTLMQSAQRDTATVSELAVLKQGLTPLLNTPSPPPSWLGSLSGTSKGLLVAAVVSGSVITGSLAYQASLDLTSQTNSIEELGADAPLLSSQQSGQPSKVVAALADSNASQKSGLDTLERNQGLPTAAKPIPAQTRIIKRKAGSQRLEKLSAKNRSKKKTNSIISSTSPSPPVLQTEQSDSFTAKQSPKETEAELLARARSALAHNPSRTLQLTLEHYKQFKTGILKEEREVLTIEALLKLGRIKEAKQRFDNFYKVFPQSVYHRRLRRQFNNSE